MSIELELDLKTPQPDFDDIPAIMTRSAVDANFHFLPVVVATFASSTDRRTDGQTDMPFSPTADGRSRWL